MDNTYTVYIILFYDIIQSVLLFAHYILKSLVPKLAEADLCGMHSSNCPHCINSNLTKCNTGMQDLFIICSFA